MVTKVLAPGGAEELVVSQLKAASKATDDQYVLLVVFGWKDDYIARVEELGVEVIRILEQSDWRRLLWPALLLLTLFRQAPNLVHTHSPSVAIVARLAPFLTFRRRRTVGHVYTEHNIWENRHRLVQIGLRLTSRLDSARFACSAGVRASLPPGIRSDTEVLRHGIDVVGVRRSALGRDEAQEVLGLPGAVRRGMVVGMVAGFRPEKRHDVAVEAAQIVCSSLSGVSFVAIGGGATYAQTETLVSLLGLEDRFVLAGKVDQASRMMRAFDLLMLSSDAEGLPVVIMEAFALGIPVVATDVGGVSELVNDNVNGLLVTPGSALELAQAVTRFAGDTTFRAAASEDGLRTASDMSADATAELLSNRYHTLTEIDR